ncbi:pectinesterase [Cadophora sp. MPI-SDFR-AT-0126]|nr:pectinesterase [Leotiomycetes sp. MPI-SDFR-AT-0126]
MKRFFTLFPLLPVVFAESRTRPPPGCVHVAKSGSNYSTIQAGINALSTTSMAAQCLFINQGTFTEQVYIAPRSAQLTIYGYTHDTTSYVQNKAILTYNNYSAVAGSNDAGSTLRVHAANVKIYNLNVVNTFTVGSQALALSAQASGGYYGCSFYGYQDTVLANEGLEYYSNCLITGAVDFVFGLRAAAWFEKCDVRVRTGGRYITANGRSNATNPSFYVFNEGTIAVASNETVPSRSYYLGRPWQLYSRTVFQFTTMSDVISTLGWSPWTSTGDLTNVYYGEYGNTGDGATGPRVTWAIALTAPVNISTILGTAYKSQPWFDAAYPDCEPAPYPRP